MRPFFADFGATGVTLPATTFADAMAMAGIIEALTPYQLERLSLKKTKGVSYVEVRELKV